MLTTSLYGALCAATVLSVAHAATSEVIPSDLSIGFASSDVQLQVSFTGDAVNGFPDGSTFKQSDVSKTPTFALGDSSSIIPAATYTIMMVDTTCDSARTLHFLQTNFKYDFDITNLASDAQPLLDYQEPGAFKETGDGRKYTWLMYGQPGNKNVSTLKMPSQGSVFDVKGFQDDNGFQDSQAGVGMIVNLGGSTSCGAAASGSASSGGASATGEGSSTTAAASSAAASSAAQSAAASTTQASGTVPVSRTLVGGESSTVTDAAESSALVAASSVIRGTSRTTVFITSPTTGSSTASGATAVETGSEASGLSLMMARCVVIASLIAFAGLLAF